MNLVDAHIGSRVRRTRELRGLTIGELARTLGVPFWQLELIESGEARISAFHLIVCGRALSVRPQFFLEGRIDRNLLKPPPAVAPVQTFVIALKRRYRTRGAFR